MKRYVFLCDQYPLGQIQFDEKRGIGDFSYCYTSFIAESLKIKPSTVVTLLEDIKEDARNFKTIEEFNRYVNSNFGNFRFEPLKGFE